MSSRFHSTNNAKWFPLSRPKGLSDSERGTLYRWIRASPGISSTELEEKWTYASSMRSRLKELYDAGNISMKKEADLFEEQK